LADAVVTAGWSAHAALPVAGMAVFSCGATVHEATCKVLVAG
jgi:hypothetical protein